VTEVPKQVEDIVRQRERTQAALDRAVRPFPAPEPDPAASRAEAFQRAQAEQREREERHEAAVRQAMFENPSPPVEDPVPDLAAWQRAGRRRAKRRGRVRP
jgi:hypothetical protein